MGHKVVYNACHGGGRLSLVAMMRLSQLGFDWAVAELAAAGEGVLDDGAFFLSGVVDEVVRHDPMLVQVVEELGRDASGRYSNLMIKEIAGDRYRIEEYDGWEKVVEPADLDWIVIK